LFLDDFDLASQFSFHGEFQMLYFYYGHRRVLEYPYLATRYKTISLQMFLLVGRKILGKTRNPHLSPGETSVKVMEVFF
jgi:hypothetical protein